MAGSNKETKRRTLDKLLRGVSIDLDTAFEIITIKNIIPDSTVTKYGIQNLLEIYNTLEELKNS